MPEPTQSKNEALQVLRGIAAVAVVGAHALTAYFLDSGEAYNIASWQQECVPILGTGVDLFFILSGFLMVHISAPYFSGKRSTGDFLAKRFIRIWPAYAHATTLVLVLAIHRAHGLSAFDASPTRLLSFIFIPSFNKFGELQPILGVGWTLNYEVLFYLTFSLVLIIDRTRILFGISFALLAIFLIGRLAPIYSVVETFFGNPIIFEFVIGATIARLYQAGRLKNTSPTICIFLGLVLLVPLVWLSNGSEWRFVFSGVPSALIFCGMLLYGDSVKWPRVTKLVGDASYSIYLVHIPIIFEILPRLGFKLSGPWLWLSIPWAICASVAGGLIYYLTIEKPLRILFARSYQFMIASRQ